MLRQASFLSFLLPAVTTTVSAQDIDLSWHAPAQSDINNLTKALSSQGVYGFIFDSSDTPDADYGTYNWCNMPHVRKREYVRPGTEYHLAYVEVIQRHHKRTPYASNAFPVEPYPWDCNDQGLYYYGQRVPSEQNNAAARTYWSVYRSPINPFTPSGWTGTCQFPQITSSGLDDSRVHGEDFWGVYGDLLGFLPPRSEFNTEEWRNKVSYRVTNNQITSQVAGQLIAGVWGLDTDSSLPSDLPLLVQPSTVDSLEPTYTCASGSALFSRIKSSADAAWAAHLNDPRTLDLFSRLDAISGVPALPNDSLGFHASFDHYFDNLSARQCHAKPLPCNATTGHCVTQDMADAVYRLGEWEYSRIYRDAGADALAASVATYGVWFGELAAHLRAVKNDGLGDAAGGVRYRHNVAHDGSVSRVLGALQVDKMVWPGMGSEIVFEIWKKWVERTGHTTRGGDADGKTDNGSGLYVRVLFGGQPLQSSNPTLGLIDMLPLETLLAYIDGLVGMNANLVQGKCHQ